MKIETTYSIMDELDDPMEDMKRRNKLFWVTLFCICFLGLIAWMVIETAPTKYTGREDYYEIEGLQIPTLYKYTQYSDVFMIREEKNHSDKNMKVEYVVIFYNDPITQEQKDKYVSELYKLGYKEFTYEGTLLYVLNSEDNSSFKYIYVGGAQAKYGVCTSGTYQKVFKSSRINN